MILIPTTPITACYISTLEDALAFFAARLGGFAFLAATSANQILALKEATAQIDALPLRGERYEPEYIKNGVQVDGNSDGLTQILEFPRHIDGVCCDFDQGTNLPIVPQRVKDACCLEALANIEATATSAYSRRRALQLQGVKSYSLGDLSESYGNSFESTCGLKSERAYKLLRIYIETTPGVL